MLNHKTLHNGTNMYFTQCSQLFPQMKSVKTNISTATWWSRPACVCMITIRRHAVPRVRVWRIDSQHTGATDRTDPMGTSPSSSPSLAGAIGRCSSARRSALSAGGTQKGRNTKRQQRDALKKQSRALKARCTPSGWTGDREKEHPLMFNDLFIRVKGQWL